MENTWAVQPTSNDEAQIEAEIKKMFAEMERADERIRRDQDEIDRLKAETRAMLTQMQAK